MFGRDAELQLLDEAWANPNTNIITFVAWGGVGKTALVNHWLKRRMARDNYRAAFDRFNPAKVAKYDQRKIDKLLNNDGIIRNRLKINSAVTNAIAFLEVQREFGSFDEYVWRFVNSKPLKRKRGEPIAARTEISDALSKDLGKRGFKSVGSTICYSFMQAVGMVNDHTLDCFRHDPVQATKTK